MTKDWRIYAVHILEAIEVIRDYRARVEAGRADEDMAAHAIQRVLETICEAATDKLPAAVKQRYPNINWKAMSGMRVRLAHAYLSIDPKVVDETIARDLDELCQAMKHEVPEWVRGGSRSADGR